MKGKNSPLNSSTRSFFLGFLLCLLLVSCVATKARFSYPYYQIDLSNQTLEAIDPESGEFLPPEKDRGLEDCRGTAQEPRPCMVLWREEFFRLKSNYLKNKEALIDYERRCN